MSAVFDEGSNPDGIIFMDAQLADRTAGGLVAWIDDGDGVKPTGTTWTQTLSARLRFTFNVDTSGDYKLHIRSDCKGRETYFWISIDSRIDQISNNENRPFGREKFSHSGQQWIKTSNNNDFYLRAGTHFIDIESIHDSINITRLSVSPTGDTTIDNLGNGSGGESSYSGMPEINTRTYIDWLNDETRNPVRALLLEMNHSNGACRFASQPYLSNRHLAYDDGIMSDPYIEESIGGIRLVGDVEVVTEGDEVSLSQLDFRGYPSRWLYGDLEWDIEDFQVLSTNTIEAVRLRNINHFQFDLVPSTDIYNRTFYTGADVVREGIMADEIDWLLDQFSGASSVKNVNVPDFAYSQTIKYEVTESTTMDTILRLIVDGFNGLYRTSQEGLLEFVIPDVNSNPALAFNSDVIIYDSVIESEVLQPYSRVTVVSKQHYAETEDAAYRITTETEVDSGAFDDEIIIEVATTNLTALERLSQHFTEYYGRKRTLYSFEVIDFADVSSIGEFCLLTSEFINTSGVINTIRRTPLTTATTIEILS